MAKVYYTLIKKGLKVIEDVPEKFKEAVIKLLSQEE